MGKGGASPEVKARAFLRRRQVLELRVAGLGFTEIGVQLGVSTARARGIFSEALRQAPHPKADEMRDLHNLRIDRMILAMHEAAVGAPERRRADGAFVAAVPPDPRAVAEIRKLMERQARLNGLDAPVRVEGRFEVIEEESIDDEIRRLSEELARNDHRDEEGVLTEPGSGVEGSVAAEAQGT